MPRKKLVKSVCNPYHITSRSNNKEWFYIPIDDVWQYAINHLKESEQRFEVKIEAFVLMSNHYHLLVYTPRGNIDKFMQFFNQNLGRSIARQAGRINRIFGASYKWNLILSDNYYKNVQRYIYQNPLREGLVSKCEEYPHSDLKDKGLDRETLAWINHQMSSQETSQTKTKLRRFILDTSNG